jgi:succinate dehydrogenase / fumarate reductase cytochrome b subunit
MSSTTRPLSPHLQVYRWQIQMVTSILHRASGIALVVGSLFVAIALVALASGEEAWGCVVALAGSWYGTLLLIGWTWSLAFHWVNGIRHLLQDAGLGYSIARFVSNSWLSVIGSLLLTGVIWGVVIFCGGIA